MTGLLNKLHIGRYSSASNPGCDAFLHHLPSLTQQETVPASEHLPLVTFVSSLMTLLNVAGCDLSSQALSPNSLAHRNFMV